MPYDILHCGGEHCPLRETCLRYTALIAGRTDFFGHPPYDAEKGQCAYYWDDRPSEEKIRQRAYQLWEQSGYQHNNAWAHWWLAQQQLIEQLRNS